MPRSRFCRPSISSSTLRRIVYAFKTNLGKMAPKGKSGEKGGAAKAKGKGKPDADEKGGKVKPAQQVNVRHILVSSRQPQFGAV